LPFFYIEAYGIHIGFLFIRFYALILMLGMGVAAWLTAIRARQHGLDADHVWNGLMWAVIPGIIGARLYHVLTPTPSALVSDGSPLDGTPLTTGYYFSHPLEILAIWHGGLGIYGAIIGGIIGVYIYAARNKQPVLKWLDLIAPAMALAQAIGRWANFVNNELYGAPTNLPWAIYIPPEKRVHPYENFSTFHPLFLYESLWNLAAFGVLLYVERRFRDRLRDGDLVLLYLMSYATIRFMLDFVRLDSNGFGPITTAQFVSLVTFIGASTAMFVRHRTVAPRQSAEVRSKAASQSSSK
jgi:phosphatidylglycerol:prolipoprotein diacylglycerol transferase